MRENRLTCIIDLSGTYFPVSQSAPGGALVLGLKIGAVRHTCHTGLNGTYFRIRNAALSRPGRGVPGGSLMRRAVILVRSGWHSPTAARDNDRVWIGWIEFDMLLGDVHSLKEKRGLVRPVIAELRRRFQVSVAEVDHVRLHRRTGVGMSCIAGERQHVIDLLDGAERLVASKAEFELLSAHRRVIHSDD